MEQRETDMPKILVVDDSLFARLNICDMLHGAGYETIQAENGRIALQKVVEEKPDCALSDLLMPEMDGIAFLTALRGLNISMPVIVLSADIQETKRTQCMELGTSGFISKPPPKASNTGAGRTDPEKRAVTMTVSVDAHFNALRDMVNMGLGRAASSLNLMLHTPIELDVPSISLLNPEDSYPDGRESLLASVRIGFEGPFTGTAVLAFHPDSAVRLVASLIGQSPPPLTLTAVMSETLTEVGNILINCIIGSIGNILDRPFQYMLPEYLEGTLEELLRPPPSASGDHTILLVVTRFQTSQLHIEGHMYLLFELNRLDPLVSLLEEPHR